MTCLIETNFYIIKFLRIYTQLWRRYQLNGVEGLNSQNRRPFSSPSTKLNSQFEQLILKLRGQRNLDSRRIQSELITSA